MYDYSQQGLAELEEVALVAGIHTHLKTCIALLNHLLLSGFQARIYMMELFLFRFWSLSLTLVFYPCGLQFLYPGEGYFQQQRFTKV